METLYNIAVQTNGGADFYLLFGDFLDAFYKAEAKTRMNMINEPPPDMGKSEYVPFLAAAAHKLAIDFDVPPPEWVFERRCYLPGMAPHFACEAKGDLRLLFMYKSPSEFKYRNLFVDENVLKRI